jgi:hypothetical protein
MLYVAVYGFSVKLGSRARACVCVCVCASMHCVLICLPLNSDHKTTCKWKGDAKYYNILVNEKTIANAAWYYPDCNEGAKNIEGMVGFYFSKVQVEKVIPGRIAH